MKFAEQSACRWQWSRSCQQADRTEWTDIDGATEKVYLPQDADLGLRLQVRCTPGCLRSALAAAHCPSCDQPYVHAKARASRI